MLATPVVVMGIMAGIVGALGAAAGISGVYRACSHWKDKRRAAFEGQFREARKYIKENRSKLQETARGLAAGHIHGLRLHDLAPLLVRTGWIPDTPIELNKMRLDFADDIVPTLWNKEPKVGHFKTYSDAILSLEKPTKMRSLRQYRLLDVAPDALVFSRKVYHYFDKINFGGFLDFELVRAQPHNSRQKVRTALDGRLSAPHEYVILAGVDTLTLLNDRGHLRLIMHLRDQEQTSTSMGAYHVIPAGEFQPSCVAPPSFTEDFDLWKNIMREAAEELLGFEEYDGDYGIPFNYAREPFNSLEREKAAGNIKPFYLGIGLDPVTFQAEILTCVVYREDVFAKIFGPPIMKNAEGTIITEKDRWGCDMTEAKLAAYYSSNTLGAAEAILRLVTRNRRLFEECIG